MSKNYYEILGVEKTSSQEDIAKAYKRLAVKYHPDKNKEKNAAIKFKEVSEAYEVLRDENKRSQYDRFGSDFSNFSQGSQRSGDFHVDPFEYFSDIFSFDDIFTRGRTRQIKGADVVQVLSITLEEAYQGCKKHIKVERHKMCSKCQGSGGTEQKVCPRCTGTGKIYSKSGFLTVAMTCDRCSGLGQIVKGKCKKCNGTSIEVSEKEEIYVHIPKGVRTGSQVRVRGKGEKVYGGVTASVPGDLIIQIRLLPHDFYKRDNDGNLYCTIPITYSQAVFGDSVKFKLLSGKMCTLKIPKGTISGTQMTVPKQGMPFGNGNRDIYAVIHIVPIISDNDQYNKIIEKLSEFEKNNLPNKIKEFQKKSNGD